MKLFRFARPAFVSQGRLEEITGRSGVGQGADDVVGGGDVVGARRGGGGGGGGGRGGGGGGGRGPLAELAQRGGRRGLGQLGERRAVLVAHGRRVARARRLQRRAQRPRVARGLVHLHYVQERRAVVAAWGQLSTQRTISY